MATGTSPSMKNLSIEEMGSLPVPLPALDEQKLIAAYLDRETARIDRLIAAKERMLALLESGDAGQLRELMPEYAGQAKAEMGFKHMSWLLGALGGQFRGAKVLEYAPLYGSGGAVVEFKVG